MQGNCCCCGTSGRGAAPKVVPEQTTGRAPAASLRVQKPSQEPSLLCYHVPHSPKSRGGAVRTRQRRSAARGTTSTSLLQLRRCFPVWLYFLSCISYFIKGSYSFRQPRSDGASREPGVPTARDGACAQLGVGTLPPCSSWKMARVQRALRAAGLQAGRSVLGSVGNENGIGSFVSLTWS